MEDWKEYRLGDICLKIGSGATPSGGKEAYKGGNFNLVRSQNVLDFSFSDDGLARINDEQAEKLKNVELHENDVLVNITGDSVARSCILPNWVLPARVNQHVCILRANPDFLDYRYLLYFIQIKKNQLLTMAAGGATRNALTKQMLEDFEINLPPLSTQQKIAQILSSLDDKIELNNKINANLEQQIEALLMDYISSENSTSVKLGDYLYIKGRIGWKGLKKEEYLKESRYRIINGETLTKSGIDWNKAGYISEERYSESPEIMLQVGDILLSKDGTIGKLGYVDTLELPTSVASGIFVIRNNNPEVISTVFIYFLLKSKFFNSFIVARTEGSVIPHLYQKDFMDFEFSLPSAEKMQEFNSITSPMFEQINTNLSENKKLSNLRDTLLPKLMNGELDVDKIEL